MKFTFSEQRESAPSKAERPGRGGLGKDGTSPRERGAVDEDLERLKEDASVFGWEFDEERKVFRPLPAL